MPIEYDIEKDVRYRQGFQKRDEIARQREEEARLQAGEARLREEEARLREEKAYKANQALLQQRRGAIERMLRKGMTPTQIAELLDVDEDTIAEVQQKLAEG